MSGLDPNTIAESFQKTFSIDGKGDNVSRSMFAGLTLGVVVDTGDPLEGGRLRIFCPTLNDNPKKIDVLPWALYISPFGGSINNTAYLRGSDPEHASTDGSTHYGFWAIPELGAQVLVGCIDGDPRRRFWIGCVPEHQQTNTIHHGRFRWDNGSVDGPLSGSNKPIEPMYSNLHEAFNGQIDSHEWRSRVAEYQTAAINADVGQIPNNKMRDSLDQQYTQIEANNPDTWEHAALGAHGYDWSGFKNVKGRKASRVVGLSSPGLHAITLDDRAFNNRLRIRTSSGHQILMDDSNERIYISTNKGKNYIEMDSNGNIDCYSENRISFHSEGDINFTTDATFRVHARDGISMYAGSTQEKHDDGDIGGSVELQPRLENPPVPGEIRLHSTADTSILSEQNIRTLSQLDTFVESEGSYWGKTGATHYQQIKENMNLSTEEGAYNVTVGTDMNETVNRNSKRFSKGTSAVAANGKNDVFSFESAVAVGGQTGVDVKASTGGISIEANSNDGAGSNVSIKSSTVQLEMNDNGVTLSSAGTIAMESGTGFEQSVDPEVIPKVKAFISVDDIPTNIGMDLPFTDPIPWDGSRQFVTLLEAIQVAFVAGFRGVDLAMAISVMLAQSGLLTLARNKTNDPDDIFDSTVGLFQIRALTDPDQCSSVSVAHYYDNTNNRLENPNINAAMAYGIWKDVGPAGEWTPAKFPSIGDGRALAFLPTAIAALQALDGLSLNDILNNFSFNLPSLPTLPSLDDLLGKFKNMIPKLPNIPSIPFMKNIIKMGVNGINMQSAMDIVMKSSMLPVMNTTLSSMVLSTKTLISAVNLIQAAADNIPGMPSLPTIPLLVIPSLPILKFPIPSINLPNFKDAIAGQIFRNNANPIASMLQPERLEKFQQKFVDAAQTRIDSAVNNIISGGLS